jgi:hypothetical protein
VRQPQLDVESAFILRQKDFQAGMRRSWQMSPLIEQFYDKGGLRFLLPKKQWTGLEQEQELPINLTARLPGLKCSTISIDCCDA